VFLFLARRIGKAKLGLTTMIDRSVKLKKHPYTQSLTKEQISTLKTAVVSSESKSKPIGSKIGGIIQNILHYCSVTPGSDTNRVCQNYGHRLGARGKDDNYLCADCKAVINGPADLRKASPARPKEVCDGSWRSNSQSRR
jgi:hypothetical protein